MKLIFAGTPLFSRHILTALIHSKHDIRAVLTQPDRAAGRGRKITPSPVKTLAEQHQIPVHQPLKIDRKTLDLCSALAPDILIVVAYGLLLPKPLLDLPKLGCINIHTSLLPRWRGAAPIQRAIEAGDAQTGVTLMQMDPGLDTGPIIDTSTVSIDIQDNTATLEAKLIQAATPLLLDTLDSCQRTHTLPSTPQTKEGVTYAKKIQKNEGCLDWSLPAKTVLQKIHAFAPNPGCYSFLKVAGLKDPVRIKLLAAELSTHADHPNPSVDTFPSEISPGCILYCDKTQLIVATGVAPLEDFTLSLTTVQIPGGKPLDIHHLLNAKADWFSVGNTFYNGHHS